MKSVAYAVVASLCLIATPALAQDPLAARVLTKVCLPYASRSQSFEKTIRAARELEFRRPAGNNVPLEDWASEIDLVSDDGNWRLRIEEGSPDQGDSTVYTASCTLSSRHASARELTSLGRRAFGDPARWSSSADNPRRWERRTPRPDENRLAVMVTETDDQPPAMTITGFYY